ncbi:MAG TPA: hypothetical protein VG406_28700 [Isosphaeraceae bacterium]|jgi:hypothetical protein|nr:hypothetical protein [Isosphaeraceae bacterium]
MRARPLASRGLALVLVLGGLAVAPDARAQSSAPYDVEQWFAQADCASTDPVTGLTTEILFAGIIETSHSPGGPPVTTTSIEAIVVVYDASFHVYFFGSAFVAADADSVAVAPNLTAAMVADTVSVSDFFDGTTVTLAFDATFDGTGAVLRDDTNDQVSTPTTKFGTHFNGSYRDATFTGTFTLDGLAFTPDVVFLSEIAAVKQGTVSFIKP